MCHDEAAQAVAGASRRWRGRFRCRGSRRESAVALFFSWGRTAPVNSAHQPLGAGIRLALAFVCLALLVVGALVATRSRPRDSAGSAGSARMMIDSNGTTRLGPLPLSNTNLRDAAFIAVSYLNNGTVAVSVAESTKFSDLVRTMDAMKRVGITKVAVRAERSPSSAPTTVTNK